MSELINNSEFRKKKLKELIKSLHEGRDFDEVKAEFSKHFKTVSTQEISSLEQELVKEGMPIEEIQRLCDVHASIFKGGIDAIHPKQDLSNTPGHPLNIFVAENRAIEKLIDEELLPALADFKKNKDHNSHLMLRIAFDRLAEIDIHYARKENLFFPYLERKNITAPPKVMWGVDDEIRADIKNVISHLSKIEIDYETLFSEIETTITKVKEMIFKEEHILIPLLIDTLNLYNWISIDEASDEFGYTLITPTTKWQDAGKTTQTPKESTKTQQSEISFDAGSLLPEEINAILNTIPIDITFVDKDNKVKYFSQGSERIFHRPKTVIGRDVGMCHPPSSVDIVDKIVDSFRSNEKDYEDFWIQLGSMFVYIRYFAVRDKDGNFLGTLEVSQNIKPLRELTGEKRIID